MPTLEQIAYLIQQAQAAHQKSEFQLAAALQEEAVAHLRQLGDDYLPTLSVQLYNLAGYYQDIGRYIEAVVVLEEVIRLDEQLDSADLEQDLATLQQARQLAAMTPEEQTQLFQKSQKYLSLTAAERDALRHNTVQQGLETIATQIQMIAIDARQGIRDPQETAAQIDTVTVRLTYDDSLGPSRYELVAFMRAVMEFLQGVAPRPVPETYRSFWDEITR